MMKRNHFVARESIRTPDTIISPDVEFTEWHLLVYESHVLSQGAISQDVRDVLEQYPFAREISVLAPNVEDDLVFKQVQDSSGPYRAIDPTSINARDFSVITFDPSTNLISRQLLGDPAPTKEPLSREIQNAWLFDLFHRYRCLVPAPDGIHFGKTSGKHSDKFLRAANALVGSLECSLLAFFLLPVSAKLEPLRVYVDTGPLVSVALSLTEQSLKRKLWTTPPTIQSFSSYDGLDVISQAPVDHLILISASTSGGLEKKILERTTDLSRIATVFYIQGKDQPQAMGHLVANLTERDETLYGYSLVETYGDTSTCKWCALGLPFAEFEGDQFLLQKRKTQRINIAYHPTDEQKSSLKEHAKTFLSLAKSQGLFSVLLAAGDPDGYRDIQINKRRIVSKVSEFLSAFEQSLTSAPMLHTSIDLLVTDDFTQAQMSGFKPFGNIDAFASTKITPTTDLQKNQPIKNGHSLVAFSVIDSMHQPRKISEILRSVTPDGETVYASMATIVESPEEFKQLASALKTGAKGPNTFAFFPGYVVLIRRRFEAFSTWQLERNWLSSIEEEDSIASRTTPHEITARLAFLKETTHATDGLFWKAQNGNELRLQRDFVYLPVDDKESQADIYAIVTNLLSTAVQLNRSPLTNSSADLIRVVLRDTVYSEALIDPNNFLKFNDAILRSAILRASSASELNYSRDFDISGTMTSLIVHEITEWQFSRGQVLLEFLTAIAIKRLRLCGQHTSQIRRMIALSNYLPPYVKRLGESLTDAS